jgi:hypothetical protein
MNLQNKVNMLIASIEKEIAEGVSRSVSEDDYRNGTLEILRWLDYQIKTKRDRDDLPSIMLNELALLRQDASKLEGKIDMLEMLLNRIDLQ